MRDEKVLILTEPSPGIAGCVSWSQFLGDPRDILRRAKCLVLTGPFAFPSPYRERPTTIPVGKGLYTTRNVDRDGEYFQTRETEFVSPMKLQALWDWAAEPGHTMVVLLPVLFEPELSSHFLNDEASRVLALLVGEGRVTCDLDRRYSLPIRAPSSLLRSGAWGPELKRLLTGHVFTMPSDSATTEGIALLGRPQDALPGTGLFLVTKHGAGNVLAAMALPWRGSPEVVFYDLPDAEVLTTLDVSAAEALLALGRSLSSKSNATWAKCLRPPAPADDGEPGPKRCANCDEQDCRTPTPGDWRIKYLPEADKLQLDIPGIGALESEWDDHLAMLKCLVDNRTRRMKTSEVFGFVVDLYKARARPGHVKVEDFPKGPPKTWKFRLPTTLHRVAQICPGWSRKALQVKLRHGGYGFNTGLRTPMAPSGPAAAGPD